MTIEDNDYRKILKDFAKEVASDEIDSISKNLGEHSQGRETKETVKNIFQDLGWNFLKASFNAGIKAGLKHLEDLTK